MNTNEGVPLEGREEEGVYAEELKDAFKEIEGDLSEIERLAAAVAKAKRENPGADFGFQDDLAEVLKGAETKFKDLVSSMIERGRARGEAEEDPNQDLLK